MKDAQALAAEVREIWDRADREARDLTLSERHEVEDLVSKAESQGRTERQIKAIGLDEFFSGGWGGSVGGRGDVFVRSSGYKQNPPLGLAPAPGTVARAAGVIGVRCATLMVTRRA